MVDLHLHSTASDGHYSPSALMVLAKELGIDTVALTDHDTLSGIGEARETAEGLGLRFVQGLEISAGGCPETHILGYGVDVGSEKLNGLIDRMRGARRSRVQLFVEKLNAEGIPITYAHVLEDAGNDNSIGRPHIGNALVRLGYAQDLSDAFAKYLVKSAKTYVPREKVSIKEAIKAINSARGVAVLAHPALLRYDMRSLENAIIYMKAIGISGVECYHPTHANDFAQACRQLSKRMSLLVTGGSDFHGGIPNANRPAPCPGDGLKFFFDGDECANRLIEEIRQRKTP